MNEKIGGVRGKRGKEGKREKEREGEGEGWEDEDEDEDEGMDVDVDTTIDVNADGHGGTMLGEKKGGVGNEDTMKDDGVDRVHASNAVEEEVL